MKFGVREICDVVFKAKARTKIGNTIFEQGQPVLYIDTAKASTIEGAATSVYAEGGKGNTRLLSWEGEKTLTFTVEDALLSPIGMAVLSGAGLFKGTTEKVHVHTTATAVVGADGSIDLSSSLREEDTEKGIEGEKIDPTAPVFVTIIEDDGSLTGTLIKKLTVADDGKSLQGATTDAGKKVFVDFYVVRSSSKISEIQIDAAHFGGYYYVEASTLFRRKEDGVDMPAEITLPNVKIQSNFTFSMSSSGDPSTFNFTMDAFPGHTIFDKTKEVICAIQIVEDAVAGGMETPSSVFGHKTGFAIGEAQVDSTDAYGEAN